MKKIAFLSLFCILFYACNTDETKTDSTEKTEEVKPTTPLLDFTVNEKIAHDTNLFTEGLLVHNGIMYESTGNVDQFPNTKSTIGTNDLKTGKHHTLIEIDKKKYFGEGIVFIQDKLYELTYKNKMGFIYDAKSFKKLGTFTYANEEGWGLSTEGTNLIMSDGTDKITYINPQNMQVSKTVAVTENGEPVININELEWINGFIYANIYTTNYIVKIDPNTGYVVGKMDCTSLANEARSQYPNSLEMNGIAYDSTTQKVYVTGKLWPTIFQINFKK